MAERLEVIVDGKGAIRAIHSDAIMPILKALGNVTVRRASHVEPSENLSNSALLWLLDNNPDVWPAELLRDMRQMPVFALDDLRINLDPTAFWADLLPVSGPVLGPFDKKQDALDAEVVWLREHAFPICTTGTCSEAPAEPKPHGNS